MEDLQSGLKKEGFDIGVTQSPVTPVYMHGEGAEATNLVLDLRELRYFLLNRGVSGYS